MTRPIRVTESTVRRIDPAEVAAALGAEPTGKRLPAAGPLTRHALRVELYRQEKSSVRPPATSMDPHVISISDQDWAELERLASTLGGPGFSPSPGQVASVLLTLALESVKASPAPGGEHTTPSMAQRLAEKVSSQT